MSPNDDLLARDLRRHDYERYLLSLFAPRARRPALWAILSLNLELSRIPELVSQPLLGQMRLAWWRDAAARALEQGEAGGNPVLQALSDSGSRGWIDRDALELLIDGHERLLLRDPDAPLATLNEDAGAIGLGLARLRLRALGIAGADDDDRARRHGIAWEITRRLQSLPRKAATGQITIPRDLAIPLSAIGSDAAANRALLTFVTEHFLDMLAEQLTSGSGSAQRRAAFPAFGDGVVLRRFHHRLRRYGNDVLDPRLSLEDGLAPVVLLWAWLRGTL